MRLSTNMLILAAMLVGPRGGVAWADGGRLAVVERRGDYQISVFTSPNPLRAGPVDVSVLLQDATTEELITDAQLDVTLTSRGTRARSIRAVATSDAATNKMLRAALVELPEPGWWDVDVVCRSRHESAQVRFAMEVGPPPPLWLIVWPWFSWPFGAVALYGIHRLLVWRRTGVLHRPPAMRPS